MRKSEKLAWLIRNKLQAKRGQFYQWLRGTGSIGGCLDHREDERDYPYLGGLLGTKADIETSTSYDFMQANGWYFEQQDNICVFATGTMLMSEMTGIRFSVKFTVKLAKKLGFIQGNGWSYLRAFLDIVSKYGLVPYELMPDDVYTGWGSYSQWDDLSEELLQSIAPKYKSTGYSQIKSKGDLLHALQNKIALYTAGKWYTGMNNPMPPNYFLKQAGSLVGGHCFRYGGFRKWGESLRAPQTFGQKYGDDGCGWVEDAFAWDKYAIYAIENIPFEVRRDHFLRTYDGKMVRSLENPACYVIEKGMKRHVPSMEIYWELAQKERNKAEKENNRMVLQRPNGHWTVKQDILNSLPDGEVYKL